MDATIINAPSSTKNASGERDPEMHQTKKGNQWYFGMKGHVGVDHKTKMIHSVAATAANVHDSHLIPDLLRGGETRVLGDSAYTGQTEKIHARVPHSKSVARATSTSRRSSAGSTGRTLARVPAWSTPSAW